MCERAVVQESDARGSYLPRPFLKDTCEWQRQLEALVQCPISVGLMKRRLRLANASLRGRYALAPLHSGACTRVSQRLMVTLHHPDQSSSESTCLGFVTNRRESISSYCVSSFMQEGVGRSSFHLWHLIGRNSGFPVNPGIDFPPRLAERNNVDEVSV